MEQPLSDIDLCEALSDLFVDNEVNYAHVAGVARAFPVAHVEQVLFDWVAPVCYTNTLTPVPPIWTGFQCDALWAEVQGLLARCDLSVGCSLGAFPENWRRQPNQSSEVPE